MAAVNTAMNTTAMNPVEMEKYHANLRRTGLFLVGRSLDIGADRKEMRDLLEMVGLIEEGA